MSNVRMSLQHEANSWTQPVYLEFISITMTEMAQNKLKIKVINKETSQSGMS